MWVGGNRSSSTMSITKKVWKVQMTDDLIPAPQGQFILFQSDEGQTRVECRFEVDTLWLFQSELCNLYSKAKATISGT